MFTGTYQNLIDSKNRMIIPAKFRDELGHRCFLTKGIDGKCLYIFSVSEWEGFVKKLLELSTLDKDARELRRNFSAGANECEIDKQGRVVIPQELREHANIEKELVTVGNLDRIEVWSEAEWDNRGNDEMSETAQRLAGYGIHI